MQFRLLKLRWIDVWRKMMVEVVMAVAGSESINSLNLGENYVLRHQLLYMLIYHHYLKFHFTCTYNSRKEHYYEFCGTTIVCIQVWVCVGWCMCETWNMGNKKQSSIIHTNCNIFQLFVTFCHPLWYLGQIKFKKKHKRTVLC
jgi:hypothetical protein